MSTQMKYEDAEDSDESDLGEDLHDIINLD